VKGTTDRRENASQKRYDKPELDGAAELPARAELEGSAVSQAHRAKMKELGSYDAEVVDHGKEVVHE
jgi:hypothetical protein